MLAKNIRQLRKKNNLTQTAFGELFGVGKTTVSSWEKGNSSPNDIIKLSMCKQFKCIYGLVVWIERGLKNEKKN